jgi:uncharacterized protein (AIM24 family)
MPEWKISNDGLLSYVEIGLRNETVRTEAGALRYYQGPIDMKASLPSVGGFFKARMTGETAVKPTYHGSGHVMLEPSLYDFFALELNDETFILDRGAYWASDMGVEVTAKMNKLSTTLLSGEGLMQTAVKGTGTVMVRAPGPVQEIKLKGDRLVVDGTFAVARSASLDFSIQQSTRSIFGTFFSGEVIVSVLQGTGTVYMAPIPNHSLILQEMIARNTGAQISALMRKLAPKS